MDPLETAILARLLVKSRRPPTESQVLKSLRPIFDDDARFRSALEHLERDGAIEALALTAKGRQHAEAALGLKGSKVPTQWRALKGLLIHVALGKKTKTAAAMRATALANKLGIETTSTSPSAVLDAWAAERLEMPGQRLTVTNVRAHVLAKALGMPAPRNPKSIGAIATSKLLGVPRPDATLVRDAVLRDWLRPKEPKKIGLDDFASTVKEAARTTAEGRFGRFKVFIAPVWDRARAELAPMKEDEFKAKLVEAHRAGLLHLTRADLTPAMPAEVVAASEVPYLNAVFHFVDLEGTLS
jgi:hypothetical protein